MKVQTQQKHTSNPTYRSDDAAQKPRPELRTGSDAPANASSMSSGRTARMPPSRDPDFKFKSDTEGPTPLKQQRLAHVRGSTPASAKPGPAAPGEEAAERTTAPDGEVRVADEVGGDKKFNVENITPRPVRVQEPPETLSHIISDTFQHPGGRPLKSLVHLYYLAKEGRTATPKEIASATDKAGPVLDSALTTAFPELLGPRAVGVGMDLGDRSSKGEEITTETVIKAMSPFDAPRESLNPEPANASPSPASLPSKEAALEPPAKAPATASFNPPTRLEDGRVGYPLSPTYPPRLPPLGPRPRHAAGGTREPGFRPGFVLKTVQDPESGKIQYKEFARVEKYVEQQTDATHREYPAKLTTDGYNSNYRGKQKEAIVLHGATARPGQQERLVYQRGRDVKIALLVDAPSGPAAARTQTPYTQFQTLTHTSEVSGEELVDRLREDQQIDLVSPDYGGAGSREPLYLLACRACRGGEASTAQQLSNATGRDVYAHSRFDIGAKDPHLLSDPSAGVQAFSPPARVLVAARNLFRPNRTSLAQLVHSKFRPNPQAATEAQARRDAASTRPGVLQDPQKPGTSTSGPGRPGSAAVSSHAAMPDPDPAKGTSTSPSHVVHGPPSPPTHPVTLSPAPAPQQALFSPMSSSEVPASGSSPSDFHSSPSTPPTYPLTIQPAPRPQRASILGDTAPASSPLPLSPAIEET